MFVGENIFKTNTKQKFSVSQYDVTVFSLCSYVWRKRVLSYDDILVYYFLIY